MWKLIYFIGFLIGAQSTFASPWEVVLKEAEGQTVYFNAWGGSPAINSYIDKWASIAASKYGVEVRHVKIDDIGTLITGIQAAKLAGRDQDGAVDVLWINGENFARMKREKLLGKKFVFDLPASEGVNMNDPTIAFDFSVSTDGLEAPWGRAQLVFMYDQARLSSPPDSMQSLLEYAKQNPGRILYPEPPNFHGTTFLKQVLLETTPYPGWLQEPFEASRFDKVSDPMWSFLDALNPVLWRQGKEFPDSAEAMMDLFADGILDIAISFNPNDASQRILDGRFPSSVRTYVHRGGTIGNTHFLAIPFNATARAGALVWINLLMSPGAQADKGDPAVWGDPTILDLSRLDEASKQVFDSLKLGPATLSSVGLGTPLPEPHASWVEPIEREWKARYFGQTQ